METSLYETLEDEFCPPLDSSLLTALVQELDANPTEDQIHQLRLVLSQLASQAERDEFFFSDELADLHLSDLDPYTTTESSITSASDSGASTDSLSSPLGFLRAALPHIPTISLNKALEDASDAEGNIDMEAVLDQILTDEYIRELEERGLGDDTNDGLIEWEMVQGKKKPKQQPQKRKEKVITLGDVRQGQHVKKVSSSSSSSYGTSDPWTQLSSLSTHLSSLLQLHPPSYFLSHFHSPSYRTPYQALRMALVSIASGFSSKDDYTSSLPVLLDVLIPSYKDLDDIEMDSLVEDTELALKATQGRGEDAIDLVSLMHDLYIDAGSQIGVMHAKSPQPELIPLPSSPPSTPLVRSPQLAFAQPIPQVNNKPGPYQWQAVHYKSSSRDKHLSQHPLAAHIPAYARKTRSGAMVPDKDELKHRRKVHESLKKRDELLREASKAWQKGRGNGKGRGGEVALYFAERAREFQEAARREALDAVRDMVESKRRASEDGTIDLHGTTVAEATIIVKEILHRHPPTQESPLKIITGRGSHSANNVSVLKPAIKAALVSEGWSVRTWDAGLVVRGKRGVES